MGITITNDSATISTTEYFLFSDSTTATYQTTDAIVQVFIDFANMAAGDTYRVRIYEKNPTTARVFYDCYLVGTQARQFVSPAFVLGVGYEVSVIRTAGSDRSIAWSLRSVT